MTSAPATGHPVRVIYAKLTSTGAYDVVARTSNISLDQARTLAERLLPGNPPLDAVVGEEIAHVRAPEGGHIVWRFARYVWADGGRGDVYITDIGWYSDDDFARARCNAFALVPRTDQVFAATIELPPVTVQPQDSVAEHARIASLHARVAGDARTVIAGAAAADPVLLIHNGERAAALELCTLLLPPRLRAELTFQTQAFRVPPVLPRITLVDRGYANLRDAPWKVLPNLDVDVPLALAGRFVELASDVAALELAHSLYEDSHPDAPGLRTGITRLVALAEVATSLLARDAAAVLRAVAPMDPGRRAAVLRRLQAATGEAAMAGALVELLRQPGDGAQQMLALLGALGDMPSTTVAALVDSLRVGAPSELVAELANRLARAGDLPRLIQLITLDRRLISARVAAEGEGLRPEVRQLLAALRSGTAAELLIAAAAVHPQLRDTTAAESLHRLCHDSVADALERVQPNPGGVDGMLRLADAADAYVAAAGTSPTLPPVMARYELAQPDAAARAVAVHGPPARAALGGALLVRAWEAHAAGRSADAERLAGLAVTLLSAAERPEVEQVRQVLHHRGIREHDLLALPGSDALLPLLGGSALQAALTRRIVAALRAIAGGSETAVQDLAAAVVAAHGQRLRITAGGELSQSVLAALRSLPGSSRGGDASDVAVSVTEVCLELLGAITDAAHLADLEDAALGDRMSARLQRLDRSIALLRAVEREDRYERYADAIESADVSLNDAARERLREALGTRGLQRRLMRAVSSVIARDSV